MIKWKCVLCHAEMKTERRPELGQRLCPDDLVRHWQRVVEIYKEGDERRRFEAQRELAAAKAALQEYRKRAEVKA